MSVEILQSQAEIDQARNQLRERKISFASPWWRRLASKLRLSSALTVGDELKSWDILKTVDFVQKNLSKTDPILDIGAFASELLHILHHLRYLNLTGIDLNPRVREMAYAGAIHYEVSDFMHTPFENESFQAISAISVIEHGFNSKLLLAEVSRLLLPGGYFIASFDYWPDKINTRGVTFFGMDWRIFSQHEVREFLDEAAEYGLSSQGNVNLAGQDRPINCAQKDYTFAWLVLQKTPNGARVKT
jgi:SAM-dependent methyltransferase